MKQGLLKIVTLFWSATVVCSIIGSESEHKQNGSTSHAPAVPGRGGSRLQNQGNRTDVPIDLQGSERERVQIALTAAMIQRNALQAIIDWVTLERNAVDVRLNAARTQLEQLHLQETERAEYERLLAEQPSSDDEQPGGAASET